MVPSGRLRGRPLRLTGDQLDQLNAVYEFEMVDGVFRRRWQHVAVFGPKSSGKSPLAAMCCIAELAGPTVPTDVVDGHLVGAANSDAWVVIGANSEDQAARTTWKPLRTMLLEAEEFCVEFGVDVGKTRVEVPGTERRIEYFGATSGSAEGLKPSLFVAEETQHAKSTNGGVQMLETMQGNIESKPGSLMLEVTNAPELSGGSFAERTFMRSMAEAELPEADRTVVLFHRTPSPALEAVKGASVKDEVCEALRFVYGEAADPEFGWVDVDATWKSAQRRDSLSARRFLLNEVVKSEDRMVDAVWWDGAARPGVSIPDGEFVVLGFDGSESFDATALVAVSCTTPPHVQTIDVWRRPADVDAADWRIPKDEVKAALHAARKRWKLEALIADPSTHWKAFVDDLADGEGWGYCSPRHVGDYSKQDGWGLVTAIWMNGTGTIVDSVTSFLVGMLDSDPPAFTHDAEPDLSAHALAMLLETDRRGTVRPGRAHDGESAQIDAGVALMLGLWGSAQFVSRGPGVDGGFSGALAPKETVAAGSVQADLIRRLTGG